jgi:RNA-directed DNA polymerase
MVASGTSTRPSRSVATVSSLCSALDISESDLNAALDLSEDKKYTPKEIPKKNGKIRTVYKPDVQIRKIQRRIKNRFFVNYGWPNHLYGSIPNQPASPPEFFSRDYIACATRHCRSKSVLSIDIENFFDNIHKDRVVEILRKKFNFGKTPAEKVAEICTFKDRVVQGGLTSSYIANLALFDVEDAAIGKLGRKNLTYTRLVDDITISSKEGQYNFDYAINVVQRMLFEAELPVNHEKTSIQYISSAPIIVHGLRVNFEQPRLPSDEPRKIRAATHNIEMLAKKRNYRTSYSYRKDFNTCMGRVNKLSRVGHNQHKPLLDRLRKVLPLSSKKDVLKANQILQELEIQYIKNNSDFWYRRRYYKLSERINAIARTYTHEAQTLRQRMFLIKPIK